MNTAPIDKGINNQWISPLNMKTSSPSREDGINAQEELKIRRKGCNFIINVGQAKSLNWFGLPEIVIRKCSLQHVYSFIDFTCETR